MKKEKEIKVNNKLQNLVNEIIDFNLKLETEENKETKNLFKDAIEDIVDMEKVAEEFKNNIINN